MADRRKGGRTWQFSAPIPIVGHASVAGRKESEGPLDFDEVSPDVTFGEKTWEKAETRMQQKALDMALQRANCEPGALDALLAGDLMNQCIASAFAARGQPVPFLGLYGACSTMAESLLLAAMGIDGGFWDRAAAVTSSHFCSAERQYRFPLEYGGQRTPTAQWTVTGAGAAILQKSETVPCPRITHGCVGTVQDYGICDANNMGAAMAPAAHHTLAAFFADTGLRPSDLDLVATGDLGAVGLALLRDLFARDGIVLGENVTDCGVLIYDAARQDVHAGGSGCGCGASVLCGHILRGMEQGKWRRVLFCATGALMSPLSSQQGESIPGVAHAVLLEMQ